MYFIYVLSVGAFVRLVALKMNLAVYTFRDGLNKAASAISSSPRHQLLSNNFGIYVLHTTKLEPKSKLLLDNCLDSFSTFNSQG